MYNKCNRLYDIQILKTWQRTQEKLTRLTTGHRLNQRFVSYTRESFLAMIKWK